MAQHEVKTAGAIFWENVNDCLEYYDYNKAKLSRLMCNDTEFGTYRKNAGSVANSLGRFSIDNTVPDNTWLAGIRDAIRIIDTENDGYPVEYSDLFTEEFYRE